jgi:hypothetical protein
VTENRAEELSKSADADSGEPQPPAANQSKDESAVTASGGGASRARGEQGDAPRSLEVDDVRAAANMKETSTIPAHTSGGVPVPGDAKGVAVPSVQAATGTSEETGEVQGVNVTALAPPGKPDGEVDTRA